MLGLSPEREKQIVDALTAPGTGWMSMWEESYDIIRGQYTCSAEDAEEILNDLYITRKVIDYVNQHSSVLTDAPVNPPAYKWVRLK
jgi:hypothetical protein